MSKGYAAFKTLARDEYCSAKEYKNHDGAADWASRALTHLGIAANQMSGKVRYPLDSQPSGATELDV
ncbi:hypothetical protein [Tropicibacter oceani]|uniref:Uncharacterized protein n=1 Tax=Tropicibacter oceani TaxID=3058420 RepID=A0ABY8QIV9_9RHOB|nr:hypothetical protein [Tropicibacter oceani]WGW04564.1 hypothetical protein QF118_03150 [Tropicibacter oceani]